MASLKVGCYTFELKKFKIINGEGYGDSLPFEGKLYANNRLIADCSNYGRGAEANIYPNGLNLPYFDKVSKYVKDKKIEGCRGSLEFIADLIACKNADEMEAKRLMPYHIVFTHKYGGIIGVPIENGRGKKIPISDVISDESGKSLVISIIAKYRQQGYECVSTNLGDINID